MHSMGAAAAPPSQLPGNSVDSTGTTAGPSPPPGTPMYSMGSAASPAHLAGNPLYCISMGIGAQPFQLACNSYSVDSAGTAAWLSQLPGTARPPAHFPGTSMDSTGTAATDNYQDAGFISTWNVRRLHRVVFRRAEATPTELRRRRHHLPRNAASAPPSTGSKRSHLTTSEVWEHFEFLPAASGPGEVDKAQCKTCGKKMSAKGGTTSHLKRHPCFKRHQRQGPVVVYQQDAAPAATEPCVTAAAAGENYWIVNGVDQVQAYDDVVRDMNGFQGVPDAQLPTTGKH